MHFNARTIFLLGLVLFSQGLWAQCPSNAFRLLDANKVSAELHNSSEQFWDFVSARNYQVPIGTTVGPAFAGSLWIGGLDDNEQLHLTASTYRQDGDFFAVGPLANGAPQACNDLLELSADLRFRGMKRLSNGDILLIDSNGFRVWNESSGTIIAYTFNQPRNNVDALEISNGKVLIFGDDTYPNKNPLLILFPNTYNLSTGPTLNWFHLNSRAIELDNGKVLFAGVVGCEVYDPVSNTSAAVPDMLYPRQKFGIAKRADGDVIAFGGGQTLTGTGESLTAQRFDDTLGYWFPVGNMLVGRSQPEVTPLPNGLWMITGGRTSGTASTEYFDPIAETFTAGPNLPIKVFRHHVVTLPGDSLYWISNGYDSDQSLSAFIWKPSDGSYQPTWVQTIGNKAVLLDSTYILVNFADERHIDKINVKTSVQNRSKWQYLWKLDRAEIDQFRQDFNNGTLDLDNYPMIASWPAHGDEGIGEDRNLAPFIDVNMDGRYRPAQDGDYPCIVGDQAIWFVHNDMGSPVDSTVPQMGVQIETMYYAVDCRQTACPDTALDYAIFGHYEITNKSNNAYHDVYIANFQDFDLGFYYDDFMGCDTTLNLSFGYNGDNFDETVDGYGTAPPAWGAALLPNADFPKLNSSMTYDNNFDSIYGNPTSALGYYYYMQGKWMDGSPMVNNGLDGKPTTAAGPEIRYLFPSTDGFCTGSPSGWNEYAIGNQPFDRKFIQGYGPVDIEPGESIKLDLVFPYARSTDNLMSLCQLFDATASIQQFWANQFDHGCFDLVVGNEPPKPASFQLKVQPNPNNGHFRAELPAFLERASYQVFSISGQMVLEGEILPGQEMLEVQLPGQSKGIYLLMVRTANESHHAKIVVE